MQCVTQCIENYISIMAALSQISSDSDQNTSSSAFSFLKTMSSFVTRSRKRDRSQFFVNIAFLVWIVSATSIEYNGASLEF